MWKKGRAAFTLVEIMVVVVIIGLLAALAIAAIKRIRLKSQATTIANDLRVFAAAFEQYATENGQWPLNADIAAVPTGMDGRINANVWGQPLVGGHQWDWDTDVNGYKAAISIQVAGAKTDSDELFQMVDSIMDDGNTSTGTFRYVSDRYMYILQN